MRNPSHLNFLLYSTLLAILIWLSSPSVKGYVNKEIKPFPLADYVAHYSITWHGINAGESIHKLSRRNNGQFHFESRSEPRLKFLPYHYIESSHFAWEAGKILPQNYYFDIKEGKRHKQGNVIFDWNTHIVSKKENPSPWETAITDGMQDKITQTLNLRQALKTGNPELNYLVAEGDKLKNYTFKILGEERLETKLGALQTLKLEHISRKGHRTIMWLATNLDYVPVKVIQYRQGKQVGTGDILLFKTTG